MLMNLRMQQQIILHFSYISFNQLPNYLFRFLRIYGTSQMNCFVFIIDMMRPYKKAVNC